MTVAGTAGKPTYRSLTASTCPGCHILVMLSKLHNIEDAVTGSKTTLIRVREFSDCADWIR
jgi:hypothetical protein